MLDNYLMFVNILGRCHDVIIIVYVYCLKIEREVHLVYVGVSKDRGRENIDQLTHLDGSTLWVTGRQKMVAMHGLVFCKFGVSVGLFC